MENSQVSSLTKVMLNISTSKDQGLNLIKGEILRGVVQAVRSDGLVSLFIKGQVIEAASEVIVKSGQQLHLMVEEFRDGRAYLKVLTPQVMERIENTNLSANLIDMGVPAKENNVMMARKLLDYNLPVTTANLNELTKAMNMLGGANPRNLELAAFALARGVPLNQSSLDSLARFTTGGSLLNQLVEDIFNNLARLANSDNVNIQKPVPSEALKAKNISTRPVQESSPVSNQAASNIEKAAAQQPVALNRKAGPDTVPKAQAEYLKANNTAAGEQAPAGGKASGNEWSASPNRISMAELLHSLPDSPGAKNNPAGESPASVKPNPPAGEKTAAGQGTQGEKPPGSPSPTGNEKSAPLQSSQMAGKPAEEQKIAANIPRGSAAAMMAIQEEIPEAARPASASVKSGSGEPPVLSRGGSGQLTAAAQEASGSKTVPTGEKAEGQRANPVPAGKAGAETVSSARAKPGDEQMAPPGGKAAQAPARQGSGKDFEYTPPASVKPAVTGDASQAAASKNTPFSPPRNNSGTVPFKGGENLPPTPATVIESLPGSQEGKLLKHLDLLRPLLDIIKIDAGDDKAAMGTKFENSIKSEAEIIKGLVLLEDIIKNDPAASKNPTINELMQKITGLEKELSGQHILNAVSRTAVDNSMNFYYFSFPVQIDNEIRLGQLRISKEIGRKGLLNQDNIKFIVSLETERLGMVLFHVDWKRSKKLEIQGVVENRQVFNHLNGNIDQLLQGLSDLGYDTKNLGIKIVDENEKPGKLRLSLEEAPLNLRPLGIDITV